MNEFLKVDRKLLSSLLNSICCYCNLTIGEFIDNIELLKTLIDGKADIHANDDEALIMAYGNDYEDVFRLFTNAKANIHAQDDEALRITSCQGHTYRY